MNITKGSWHYRLARLGADCHPAYMPTNICPYMRAVLFGLLKFVLIGLCGSLVVALFAVAIIGIVTSLIAAPLAVIDHFYHFLPSSWYVPTHDSKDSPFIAAAMVGGIFYVVFGVFGIFKLTQKAQRKIKNLPPKEPGLISMYLKGVHDKTCIGLEYIDKETS
jgi:hypothetical protein